MVAPRGRGVRHTIDRVGTNRGISGGSTTARDSTNAEHGASSNAATGGSYTAALAAPRGCSSAPGGSSAALDSSLPSSIGVDATSNTTTTPSRLPTLTIVDGELSPHHKVPSAIYKIFKKTKNPTGYTWKLTPDSIKETYWEEFKRVFSWDSSLNDAVYEAWRLKAAARYRGFAYGLKTSKKGRPEYISELEWEGWKNYWDSEDVKAKSEIAKRCRMSEPDGPGTGQVRHRGGSKSCLKYAVELAAEKGVQTKDCLHDAFEYMHRTKDGSYTDAKSERIAKEIKELAEEMAQPLPGTTEPRHVDLNKCYLEVTGGLDRKGRLFGGGSLAKSLRSNDLDSAATSSQIDRQEIDNRLEEMEQRLEREQEERKQLYEQVQAQQKLIQELISKSSQSAPSSS